MHDYRNLIYGSNVNGGSFFGKLPGECAYVIIGTSDMAAIVHTENLFQQLPRGCGRYFRDASNAPELFDPTPIYWSDRKLRSDTYWCPLLFVSDKSLKSFGHVSASRRIFIWLIDLFMFCNTSSPVRVVWSDFWICVTVRDSLILKIQKARKKEKTRDYNITSIWILIKEFVSFDYITRKTRDFFQKEWVDANISYEM